MIRRIGLVNAEELKMLIPDMIEIRRDGRDPICFQPDYELKKTLNGIISTDFYKQDYSRNTKKFLAEDVSYEETIESDFLPNVL